MEVLKYPLVLSVMAHIRVMPWLDPSQWQRFALIDRTMPSDKIHSSFRAVSGAITVIQYDWIASAVFDRSQSHKSDFYRPRLKCRQLCPAALSDDTLYIVNLHPFNQRRWSEGPEASPSSQAPSKINFLHQGSGKSLSLD